MSVSINVVGDVISGSVNGEIFSRTYDEKLYQELLKVQEEANSASSVEEYSKIIEKFKSMMEESLSGYIESINPYIHVNRKTGAFHLKYNGNIISDPMPEALHERIKASIDKKIDVMPLIKCFVRWLRNPKRTGDKTKRFFNFMNILFTNSELVAKLMKDKGYSEEIAGQMATAYSMKVTNEGLLAGYKVSTEITDRYKLDEKGNPVKYDLYKSGKKSIDEISGLVTYEEVKVQNENRIFEPAVQGKGGDAFYCGDSLGHIIKVGQVHRLPDWSMVDCNDNTTCRPGLHVGGLDYIRGYQNDGTETHNVFIDPSHVGAVPDDTQGAIRCLQYFVCDAFSGVNGSIYHSSTYAKFTDEQWIKELEAIKKEHQTEVAKRLSSVSEKELLS